MNTWKNVLVPIIVSLFFTLSAYADCGMCEKGTPHKHDKAHSHAAVEKTVVGIAVSDAQFSTLVSLLKEADLVDTLNGNGPFTVFAPTNEAFAKVPAETLAALKKDKKKLQEVLTYHVVGATVKGEKAATLSKANTVAGKELTISSKGETLMINDAKVVKADIIASNGVIHVVDTVLIPN